MRRSAAIASKLADLKHHQKLKTQKGTFNPRLDAEIARLQEAMLDSVVYDVCRGLT